MLGITNPAEEYFKDGLWGWVSTAWEKLVSSGGRLFTALHGWDGSAWRKLPLVWGYYDTYSEAQSAIDVTAGHVTISFGDVDAGEVWVVQHFSLRPSQANADRIVLRAIVGGKSILLKNDVTLEVYQTLDVHHDIVLAENDYLQAYIRSASGGDDYYAYACGYKMKIAE